MFASYGGRTCTRVVRTAGQTRIKGVRSQRRRKNGPAARSRCSSYAVDAMSVVHVDAELPPQIRRFSSLWGLRIQLVQQGKVTGCVNFKGPSQDLGPARRTWGPGPQGLGARGPRAWGPGARAAGTQN